MTRNVLLAISVAVALVAAIAPSSILAANPIAKSPESIHCPSAPSGWFLPSQGGKQIADAQTDIRLRPSKTVTVNCHYFARSGKMLLVNVQYALATDPNPGNDFYFGCGSTGTPWSPTARAFRLTSVDQWAIAGFYDPGRQLRAVDVGGFEKLTRELLQNAEGYGHACSLTVAPTEITSDYRFTFQLPAGHAAGTFLVAPAPGQVRDPAPIVYLRVPNITLNVAPGATERLTIRVTRGLKFYPATPVSPRRATFAVAVVRSNVPACKLGATGTLTVSARPSVSLELCGRALLRGPAKATIVFLN